MKTVQKWVQENDKELNTATWLFLTKLDRENVAMLKCSVYIKFKNKLLSTTNYNATSIVGSKNLRTSLFKDHTATDMHTDAMLLYKSISSDTTEYTLIAKALSTFDLEMEAKVKKKFETVYFVDYIAQAQREVLLSMLAKAKSFSTQADSSPDSGNVEDELYVVQYFNPHGHDGKVHTCDKFLTVRQPNSSNAEGLHECFVRALSMLVLLTGRAS